MLLSSLGLLELMVFLDFQNFCPIEKTLRLERIPDISIARLIFNAIFPRTTSLLRKVIISLGEFLLSRYLIGYEVETLPWLIIQRLDSMCLTNVLFFLRFLCSIWLFMIFFGIFQWFRNLLDFQRWWSWPLCCWWLAWIGRSYLTLGY